MPALVDATEAFHYFQFLLTIWCSHFYMISYSAHNDSKDIEEAETTNSVCRLIMLSTVNDR